MRFVSSIFFTLAIALIGCPLVYAQEVPAQMTYCGIELKFTPAARQRVQEHVQKITASPRYFNEMVKRACTFLPFVEEAFDKMDVPHDLKYLVIQESSLRATAVSPSKAVGFWQFKIGTAKEVGLRVDDEIDERMHIYRASEGAAIYLSKANYNFDNWVYSLLAYREGPTGALAYVNRENFGKQKMTIEEDVHPYIINAFFSIAA
ncbi:MAG: lytic transglycosylase domain-containing protein [Bacteroidota bacterium]